MGRAEDLFSRLETGGESVLDEFIVSRKSEELFLDFKRSSDNGTGTHLSDTDRQNLSKAISGFGNSEGGIVVWGVDCSRDVDGADVARAKVPINQIERFISWLENAVSGCTIPPHSFVVHRVIKTTGEGKGFAVTLIPSSDRAPHQDVVRKLYYIRAGSNFEPTPHAVLAGMFGRRPQPNVVYMFTVAPAQLRGQSVHCEVGILLRNQGPGIAKDLFLNILAYRLPGPECALGFQQSDQARWGGIWSFGRHMSLISQPDYRLPPEAHVQPLVLEFDIAPPFETDIRIEGIVGSGNSVPHRFMLSNSVSGVSQAYETLSKGRGETDKAKDFAKSLLRLDLKETTGA